MDNHYVPNLTMGPLVCQAIRPHTTAPIDVHLMVKPVDRIIPDFAKAGANIITFHPEASDHVDRSLALIRDQGCQAGLVFNPATPLHYLDYVMKRGLYGGAIGYLGFQGDMDLAIAIRTALIKDGQLHVQAGAGIVADSDPQTEWQETQNKARAVLRAAEIAETGLDTRLG